MIWAAMATGLAIISAAIDGISTVIGLEVSETSYEQSPLARVLHQFFGLRRGQAAMFLIQSVFWIGFGWLTYSWFSLSLLTLIVGAYFGLAVRQLITAYDAMQVREFQKKSGDNTGKR